MNRIFTLFPLLILVSILNAQPAKVDLKALDSFIEQARQQWKAPGLAVAIVKDGQVVFQKGYGMRRLDGNEPVNEQTLFAMCSTTKAMTAAAVAILVDRGLVKWDDPVSVYMPEFLLSDPYISRDIRVRDLLTHNSGLGNADFLWWNSDLDQQQILARMRYAPMAYPLRGGYTYQNIMYLAAGALVEKISGKSWADFIRDELLLPLGMTRTYPLQSQIPTSERNRSTAHHYVKGAISPIPDTDIDPIGPAGSIWSSVADLTKWMNFLLDSARVNGRRLISAGNFHELFKPQIIISPDQFYPTVALTKPHWTTYGLGWFQHDYQGRAVSFHTGSIDGTVAICGLIPEERLGVYVFGNLDHAEVRHAIMYKVFDVFGGQPKGRDWSADFLALYDGIRRRGEQARAKFEAARVKNTQPSHPLEDYIGVYEDPFFGKVTITLTAGQLRADLSSKYYFTLEHWHYDVFLGYSNLPWDDPNPVQFELDAAGRVAAVKYGGARLMRQATE